MSGGARISSSCRSARVVPSVSRNSICATSAARSGCRGGWGNSSLQLQQQLARLIERKCAAALNRRRLRQIRQPAQIGASRYPARQKSIRLRGAEIISRLRRASLNRSRIRSSWVQSELTAQWRCFAGPTYRRKNHLPRRRLRGRIVHFVAGEQKRLARPAVGSIGSLGKGGQRDLAARQRSDQTYRRIAASMATTICPRASLQRRSLGIRGWLLPR